MDDQNKNLILATVLSFLVVMVWFWLFPPEEIQVTDVPPTATAAEGIETGVPSATGEATTTTPSAPAAQTVAVDAPRVTISTPDLTGSLSLQGARIDDLSLLNYREELAEESDIVHLLKPVGEANAYFASFGWASAEGINADQVPGPDTIWEVEAGSELTPDTPVTLRWDNGAGQIFRTIVSVDDKYMFDFAQSVENTGGTDITLRPYGLLRRHGEPADLKNFFILHEGLVRMTDGELEETSYDNIIDYEADPREGTQAERLEATENGWIGYTDHYWMTTLIPEQGSPFRSTSKYFDSRNLYQAEAVMPLQTVAAGASAEVTTRLFAGPKEWEAIRDYEDDEGVTGFLDSIDWGWFFFLTKPIFWLLHHLHLLIGNMGWAIIALTFILKALVLPLAYKSYVSMAKMKELQPQMEALKEKSGEDKQAMQQGMMKLYKENKVNPAAGCMPILL